MLVVLALLVAVVSAAAPGTFTPVFTRTSATTLAVSVNNPPANLILIGWGPTLAQAFASDVVICAPGSAVTCLDVTCQATDNCAVRGTTILTTNTVSATSISFVRNLTGTVILADGTPQYLLWLTDTLAAPSFGAAVSKIWTNNHWTADLPAWTPTTVPTFPVTFSRPSATAMGVSFPTPPAGQTIFYGWRSAETVGWPADAVICAPGFVATCLDVACTDAATCATRPTTMYTTNTVSATNINLVRTLAPLVDGGKQYLAYATSATAAGTATLLATSAQNKSWSYYTADVPAYTPTTVPSFAINLSRPSDTTIAVSIPQPPASQNIFYGWRSAETVGWPADAVVCAPGAVSTCLDVSCTSTSTCAARTPTIYTTNAVTATSVSLVRPMAAGNVPIVAANKMWLAYTTAATPAGTTTLDATTVQSRTWSYYSSDVPAVNSNAMTVVPALVATLCAILYVL